MVPNNALLIFPTKLNSPLVCFVFSSFVWTMSNSNRLVVSIRRSLCHNISEVPASSPISNNHPSTSLVYVLNILLKIRHLVIYGVQRNIYYYCRCGVWQWRDQDFQNKHRVILDKHPLYIRGLPQLPWMSPKLPVWKFLASSATNNCSVTTFSLRLVEWF